MRKLKFLEALFVGFVWSLFRATQGAFTTKTIFARGSLQLLASRWLPQIINSSLTTGVVVYILAYFVFQSSRLSDKEKKIRDAAKKKLLLGYGAMVAVMALLSWLFILAPQVSDTTLAANVIGALIYVTVLAVVLFVIARVVLFVEAILKKRK